MAATQQQDSGLSTYGVTSPFTSVATTQGQSASDPDMYAAASPFTPMTTAVPAPDAYLDPVTSSRGLHYLLLGKKSHLWSCSPRPVLEMPLVIMSRSLLLQKSQRVLTMSIVDDSMRFRANVWSSVNSNCGSLASFRTSVSVEFGSRERHEASLV